MLACKHRWRLPSIALLARKGGVGKTTLAVHMAVLAGPGALLVDADPQRSAAQWAQIRDRESPAYAVAEAGSIGRHLPKLRAPWIIVDAPPFTGAIVEEIASVVDLVLIPTRPGILDLRAISSTVETVRKANVKAMVVLNACRRKTADVEAATTTEAREALKAYGVPVCPVSIGTWADLVDALASHRAVEEYRRTGKAAAEMRALWDVVQGEVRQ